MTRVCIVGTGEGDLRRELLSRETAREALSTYDLRAPFADSLAVDTASLGAGVSLLNDLDWYLARFARLSMVLEPSIDPGEWLSRDLAAAVRREAVAPAETGTYLAVYGRTAEDRLVEPMYVTRSGGDVPAYDLREVPATVRVRVTEGEFGGRGRD